MILHYRTRPTTHSPNGVEYIIEVAWASRRKDLVKYICVNDPDSDDDMGPSEIGLKVVDGFVEVLTESGATIARWYAS